MGQHTPGPWHISSFEGWDCVRDRHAQVICKLALNEPANARVLAAAPDLLDVAQTVVNVIHSVENRCMAADGPVTPTCDEITDAELRQMYEAARTALRAATGDPT